MAFTTTFYHNEADIWSLYQKVIFDGENKIITVADGVTTLDIQEDLYSDWKEWISLRDYTKFLPAIRTIGGDPTSGGQKAGDIYFLINGWRIAISLEDTAVSGVLYSDDYDTPWISKTTGNPVYPASVSNLVLKPAAGDLSSLNIPTAAQNATAVRTELSSELANVDASISSRATQASVDALQADVTNLQSDVTTIDLNITNMSTVINDLYKYGKNRTKIDKNAFTLTIYDDDGTTPIKIFNLKDSNGVASVDAIYERIPV